MMKNIEVETLSAKIIKMLLSCTFICCTVCSGAQVMHQLNVRPDTADIQELVVKYAESINNADSGLAYTLFAQTGLESFVHPGGFEQGWKEISKNIYRVLGNRYAKRKWTIVYERIWLFECAISVEMEWVLDTTLKKDNTAQRTKGKETQLWAKLKGEWKLVQVHDSDIPDMNQP
jgi:hypothetical protein